MRVATSSFMRKPNIDSRVETAEGQGAYEAARGLSQAADTTAKLVERNQRLQAAADITELKAGMASWITERENSGDIDDLPNRLTKEMAARYEGMKKQGGFYAQAMQEAMPTAKAQLSGLAENAVVNATLAKNREAVNKIIANTTVLTRAEPHNMEANIASAKAQINEAFLSPKEKEELIGKLNSDVSLAVMDSELSSSPTALEQSIRKGRFKDYASVERQEQFLKIAAEKSAATTKTNVYAYLYNRFKDANGAFDYQSAVSFLRNPANQSELGLTAEGANSVGDMLYSQFTQENTMRETARSNAAVAEIDVAIDNFYKGNAAVAIQAIQESKNIKGDDKPRLISLLKNGRYGKDADFYQTAEAVRKIAKREINTEEELQSLVIDGKLMSGGYNTARDFLKKRDEKGFAHVQRALDQLKSSYGSAGVLGGRMTPAETEAYARMTTEIMDLWNDLVSRGAGIDEIRETFSPSNIDGIGKSYSPNIKDNLQSMMDKFEDKKGNEYAAFIEDLRAQAKGEKPLKALPNENPADFLSRKRKN